MIFDTHSTSLSGANLQIPWKSHSIYASDAGETETKPEQMGLPHDPRRSLRNPNDKKAHSANPLLSYIGAFTKSLPLPFLPPSIIATLHQATRSSVVAQHSRIVAKFINSASNTVWYAPDATQENQDIFLTSNNQLLSTISFPPISASISPPTARSSPSW